MKFRPATSIEVPAGGGGATGQQRCAIFGEERCLQRRGGQTQEVRQRNERQEAEGRIRGCSDRDAAAAQCAVATVHLSEGEPGSQIISSPGQFEVGQAKIIADVIAEHAVEEPFEHFPVRGVQQGAFLGVVVGLGQPQPVSHLADEIPRRRWTHLRSQHEGVSGVVSAPGVAGGTHPAETVGAQCRRRHGEQM